jgi:AhpD family alkylhydroperoxidase
MEKQYPEYLDHLRRLTSQMGSEMSGTMSGFAQLHRHAMADGVLTAKVKELIALGIAIAVRCEGCIAYHVNGALSAGATHQEIVETIGVAIMMGGGPATVYGAEAFDALILFVARGRRLGGWRGWPATPM